MMLDGLRVHRTLALRANTVHSGCVSEKAIREIAANVKP